MDTTRQQALSIYAKMQAMHHEAFIELGRLKSMVATELDIELTVDALALMKKSDELLKSARHELEQAITQLSKVACVLYVQKNLIGETIHTEWVNATPGSKPIPKLPRYDKEPEQFKAMANYFGITEPMAYTVWRPHWPTVQELLAICDQEGRPYPPGLDGPLTTTQYTVTCRWNKGVDPDVLVLTSDVSEGE